MGDEVRAIAFSDMIKLEGKARGITATLKIVEAEYEGTKKSCATTLEDIRRKLAVKFACPSKSVWSSNVIRLLLRRM